LGCKNCTSVGCQESLAGSPLSLTSSVIIPSMKKSKTKLFTFTHFFKLLSILLWLIPSFFVLFMVSSSVVYSISRTSTSGIQELAKVILTIPLAGVVIGSLGLVMSIFLSPFYLVWAGILIPILFCWWKKIKNPFVYLWLWGSVLTLLSFFIQWNNCDYICGNGDPISESAYIFYVSFAQIFWMPFIIRLMFWVWKKCQEIWKKILKSEKKHLKKKNAV
jgi:hypothetical protein